jgi:hypothetical protein
MSDETKQLDVDAAHLLSEAEFILDTIRQLHNEHHLSDSVASRIAAFIVVGVGLAASAPPGTVKFIATSASQILAALLRGPSGNAPTTSTVQ